MTVIRPNSVAGINSITVQSGEALSVHKSDGTLIRTLVSSSGVSTFTSVSVGSATTDNSANNSINVGLGASISQPETNVLTLGTGGDERFRIDANGDINLGNNPTNQFGYKLNIQDSAIIYAQTASSGGLEAKWHLDNSAELMEFGTVSTDDLALVTTNIPRVRIDSGGDVGIGTDTMNAPLTVVQNDASGHIASFRQKNAGNSAQILIDSPTDNNIRPASIDLAQAGTIKWSLGQAYSAGSDRAFHIATSALSANDTNAKLTITTAGRVGISSQIPSRFLDVVESSGTGLVQFKNLQSSFSNDCYTLLIDNTAHTSNMSSAGSFAVETSDTGHGTRAFTIAGDGDVGIGTANPDGSLAICHTSTTDMLMFNVPGSVGTFAKMGHNTASGTNMLDIRSEGHTRFLTNGNNESMRITNGNDVIIGGDSIGDSGSFGVQSSGAFRSILAASTASDTLLGAISGVSLSLIHI